MQQQSSSCQHPSSCLPPTLPLSLSLAFLFPRNPPAPSSPYLPQSHVRATIVILQEALAVKFPMFKLAMILALVRACQQAFGQHPMHPPAIHDSTVGVLGYAHVCRVQACQTLRVLKHMPACEGARARTCKNACTSHQCVRLLATCLRSLAHLFPDRALHRAPNRPHMCCRRGTGRSRGRGGR